jgi:hypothetical protein
MRIARVPQFLRTQRDTVQLNAGPEIPLFDSGAPDGVHPALLRNPGAEGLDCPDRPSRHRKDHPASSPSWAPRPRHGGLLRLQLDAAVRRHSRICPRDLGVAKLEESQAQRFLALHNFLIERERVGQNTVLIIDEAQNLDAATLEQIQVLSNGETATSKRVQILLAGPDELKAKIDLAEHRQLKQQAALRCQIAPLTPQEVSQYIRNRLCVAGVHHRNLFTEAAIDRITEYAGGIPRVINTLGDHCLLFGYAEQKRRIDRLIVDQAIEYLEEGLTSQRSVWSFGASKSRRQFKWVFVKWVLGTLMVVLGSVVVAFVLSADADDYNCQAPHSALGMRPPAEYRAGLELTPHCLANRGADHDGQG